MNAYTVAWLAWLAAFAAIEGRALFNRRSGDTLSEHVWRWFAVRGGTRFAQARRAVLLMGMAWLTAHFVTGGRF